MQRLEGKKVENFHFIFVYSIEQYLNESPFYYYSKKTTNKIITTLCFYEFKVSIIS